VLPLWLLFDKIYTYYKFKDPLIDNLILRLRAQDYQQWWAVDEGGFSLPQKRSYFTKIDAFTVVLSKQSHHDDYGYTYDCYSLEVLDKNKVIKSVPTELRHLTCKLYEKLDPELRKHIKSNKEIEWEQKRRQLDQEDKDRQSSLKRLGRKLES